MIFWTYNVLLILLAIFWVPWMIWRASKRKDKPDWKQRTGDLPLESPKKGVRRAWIHAVSVGEVLAARPILKEIRKLDPDLEIVLSTTTSSGQTAAKENAEGLFDHLVYFPIDVPRFVIAAMIRVRPKVVAIMETELWMNFLWAAKEFRATTILVNARVSDRSFPRSVRIRPYYKALFANLDRAMAQTKVDADRLKSLGFADPEVVGNCKFDGAIEDTVSDKDWREELGIPRDANVVVVGSTRSEHEEKLVVAALKAADLDVWVVHAPRHIESAPGLAELYREQFGAVALRSKGEHGRFLVLDTYGELAGVYAIADIVVLGGSFDDLGGQNLLQPLAHGKPVIHGPHMQNFKEAAAAAAAARAAITARNEQDLTDWLKRLMGSDAIRTMMGRAAKELVEENLGASRTYAEAIVEAARPV